MRFSPPNRFTYLVAALIVATLVSAVMALNCNWLMPAMSMSKANNSPTEWYATSFLLTIFEGMIIAFVLFLFAARPFTVRLLKPTERLAQEEIEQQCLNARDQGFLLWEMPTRQEREVMMQEVCRLLDTYLSPAKSREGAILDRVKHLLENAERSKHMSLTYQKELKDTQDKERTLRDAAQRFLNESPSADSITSESPHTKEDTEKFLAEMSSLWEDNVISYSNKKKATLARVKALLCRLETVEAENSRRRATITGKHLEIGGLRSAIADFLNNPPTTASVRKMAGLGNFGYINSGHFKDNNA